MLSLHNVSKTYVSKAKTETQALKDVSLDIAGRGMVFILGKSGSGKSTLLNLLGGLDSPTSGEIFVDGVSMQQFTPKDYAAYRNNYVGFIFQEFNLLADFDVRDNVALALRLTKADDMDAKVSAALQQVELNDGYLNRRIDEMSGGEKQRIAIARALIKDSKLILADEPTGNLDSATGESIWKILKSLSRERLVIVVSHDRESAEKYADRIIEIADGQIVSDNGKQPATEDINSSNAVSPSQSRLSFATRLKMGYNNLRQRKVKTASVILIAVFSILSLLIMQMCLSFSAEAALAEYITKYNVDYFQVSQGSIDNKYNIFSPYGDVLKNNTKQYVADNCKYINNGLIESKQDILDIGLTFVGEALEIDDVSYYTTTSAIEQCYRNGQGVVEVDGEYVTIIKEYHPIEFLIGKKVKIRRSEFLKDSVLAGVIDTDNIVNKTALPSYFYNKNFDAFYNNGTYRLNESKKKYVLQFGDKQYDREMNWIDCEVKQSFSSFSNVIVTADGTYGQFDEVALADNEIILPYEIYAQLFDTESKWYFVSTDLKEVHRIPKEIGQTFTLKICEYETDEVYADYGEVKLVGVSFAPNNEQYDKINIITNRNFHRQIRRDLSSSLILIQTSSVKNLSSFATKLRRSYNGSISDAGRIDTTETNGHGEDFVDASVMAYGFEQTMMFVSFVFLAMGVILTIILILLVINLISLSIANRKKEIGILSAIGASNKDITSVFLLETSIISTISFVIVLVMAFVAVLIFNVIISKTELLTILFPFLRVDMLTVAILAVMSFGLLLVAAMIPIRVIVKLKPIDAIRNI